MCRVYISLQRKKVGKFIEIATTFTKDSWVTTHLIPARMDAETLRPWSRELKGREDIASVRMKAATLDQ